MVADATGSQLAPYGATGVAAWRGHGPRRPSSLRPTWTGVTSRGEGRGVTSQYSAALLYNGLGRYEKALAAAEQVCESDDIGVLGWSLAELIEAAVRSGSPRARPAHSSGLPDDPRQRHRLGAWREARSRALVGTGEDAEKLYREAIERLERTRAPSRGSRPPSVRRVAAPGEPARDARAELRTAYDLFASDGHRGVRRAGPA